MYSIFRTQLFVAFSLLVLISHVIGHSYVTTPITRSNQKQSNAGCRGPSCLGPCDVPLSQKSNRPNIVVSRGNNITIQWPRNNHAGGFIRFAWALTSQSDSHAAFDSHVQQINCHEVGGCRPDNAAEPNGGDSGPADGSSRACKSTLQVPLDLSDGEWTLQWAWFGGAFSLGDYYSCVDYTISGGPSGTLTPVFIGGDYSFPNQQKCKFFNTDKLHKCTNEPCNAPIYPSSQQQSGPVALDQLGAIIPPLPNPIPTTPSTPSTPVSPPVQPSTTGRAIPASVPASPIPSSTPSIPSSPVTTGRASTVPVTPSVPSSNNCARTRLVSSSQAMLTTVDTWSGQFHGIVEIHVAEEVLSDWVLEITWPAATRVSSSFNGGKLQCEESSKSYFVPTAFWSNNLASGSVTQVEFIASNPTNLDSSSLIANTRLRVLKR